MADALVCDSSFLIDVANGELTESVMSLDCRFVTTVSLYRSELERRHPHLADMGLQLWDLLPEQTDRILALMEKNPGLGYNDLSLPVLAQDLGCPMLTGDALLREVAEGEQVEVRGTIWVVELLLLNRRIIVQQAREAFRLMRSKSSWLPWALAEEMLRRHERAQQNIRCPQ